jgi:hypothetical protein
MHGKMISNDRSEHLPRPPWRNSLQRRWQAPRACRSRPQRRRSRPGKIVGVRFRVRTNFDHGLQSATACGTWRRSSPKAARPSTRSTCGSMIRGYGRWARQPNTDVIAQWVHRRRGTGRRADVLDPLASPSSPRRMGRAGASLDHPLIVVTHDAVIRPLQINIAPALPLPNVATGFYQLLRRHSTTWRIERANQLP